MLSLRPIDYSSLDAVTHLQVAEHQRDFVADNAYSMMEAYLALSRHEIALPFGIYHDETAIGFVMFGYGKNGFDGEPACAEGSYSIWRFMIDQRYQRRGYGREALQLSLDYVRTMPAGPAERCWLSYHPENDAARMLYASVGFAENGERCGNEIVAVIQL